jgi:glycerol-3-phosphate dehydrogenase
VDEPTRERLEFLYGTEIEDLVRYASEDPSWAEPLGPGVPALRGEVRFAVERGMAHALDDVMDRRLALLIFARNGGWAAAGEAASILARLLGWDPARREAELEGYRRLVTEHGPRGIDTAPGLG